MGIFGFAQILQKQIDKQTPHPLSQFFRQKNASNGTFKVQQQDQNRNLEGFISFLFFSFLTKKIPLPKKSKRDHHLGTQKGEPKKKKEKKKHKYIIETTKLIHHSHKNGKIANQKN